MKITKGENKKINKNIENLDSFDDDDKSISIEERQPINTEINTDLDNTLNSFENTPIQLNKNKSNKNIKHNHKKSVVLNEEICSIDKDIDKLKNKLRKMVKNVKN